MSAEGIAYISSESSKRSLLPSKAVSFLKKISNWKSRLGWILRGREKDSYQWNLKRPHPRIFHIDVPTRDSDQRNSTVPIDTSCDPFLLNQNLQHCHLGSWKSPSASSLSYYYSLHNPLLFLWWRILLLIVTKELSNSNYLWDFKRQ